MSHTHTYYRWTGGENTAIVTGATLSSCALDHANCVASDLVTAEFPFFNAYFVDSTEDTTEGDDTTSHTHQYYKLTVTEVTTTNLLEAVSGDHCTGDGGAFGITTGNVITTATSEALATTSDAIWDGDNHYHIYLWCDATHTFVFTGVTTCADGHANCKRVTVGDKRSPNSEAEADVGYWWELETGLTELLLPTVTTGDATNITYSGAELWGTITPTVTYPTCACGFQYGKTASYGSTAVSGTYTTSTYFGATITGLETNMVYYFRAYATYGEYTTYGNINYFTTNSATPSNQAGYVWIEGDKFHFSDASGVEHAVEGT